MCGARFVVGGIEIAGVHVTLSHFPARPTPGPMYRSWGMLVRRNILRIFPCVCECGFIVICLKRWARVCRSLQVGVVLYYVFPSL